MEKAKPTVKMLVYDATTHSRLGSVDVLSGDYRRLRSSKRIMHMTNQTDDDKKNPVESHDPAGAPGAECGITAAMMEAGREAFFETMTDLDYLAVAPTIEGLDTVILSIFQSMSLAKPRDLSHST